MHSRKKPYNAKKPMKSSSVSILVSLAVVAVAAGFFILGKENGTTQNGFYMFNAENTIDWNSISFAGEKAPLDESHPLNREKFERELLVAEFNVSQFILYHKRSPSFFPFIEKTLKDA